TGVQTCALPISPLGQVPRLLFTVSIIPVVHPVERGINRRPGAVVLVAGYDAVSQAKGERSVRGDFRPLNGKPRPCKLSVQVLFSGLKVFDLLGESEIKRCKGFDHTDRRIPAPEVSAIE